MCAVCAYVCITPCVCRCLLRSEEESGPLELELQVAESADVGSANQTQVMWKSNKCS